MTIVGDFFSRMLGSAVTHRQVVELDMEIARHKATIRQNTQVLESGSRVMQNMTGMMRMMAEADENE